MKKRAPEPEPHSSKPRAQELEPCLWKEEIRSRSFVIFTTTPQPWNNPHRTRAHRQSRVKIRESYIALARTSKMKICKKVTNHVSRLLKLTQWSISRWASSPHLCFFAPVAPFVFFVHLPIKIASKGAIPPTLRNTAPTEEHRLTWTWFWIQILLPFSILIDFIISVWSGLKWTILFWISSQVLVQFRDCRLAYCIDKLGSMEFLKLVAIAHMFVNVEPDHDR